MAINGLMIHGATSFLQGNDDAVPEVSVEPVYLSAEYIDSAIADGSLLAGALANVQVSPPPSEWPERWRFLKE